MPRFNRFIWPFLYDGVAAALAFAFSLFLRLGEHVADAPLATWLPALAIFTAISGITFWLMGLYRGVWRYVSLHDLLNLVKAVSVAIALFVPLCFVITRLEGVPRSLPGILWFVQLAFMAGARLTVRAMQEGRLDAFWMKHRHARTPVLLVGSMDEAELFIRASLADKQAPYHVVGVLDNAGTRNGRQIHNVTVLGGMAGLEPVVQGLKRKGIAVTKLILSKSAARMEGFDAFAATAQRLGLSLAHLPDMTQLQTESGAFRAGEARPIALEDLLGRAETLLNRAAIQALVQGKRVLVTGAGGTIGAELVRQIAALNPASLVLLENSEFNLYRIDLEMREKHPALPLHSLIADVRDSPRMLHLFHTHQPHLVFHAAALKHVPMAEANLRETVLTNVLGSKNIADAAFAVQAEAMVLISTDKAVRPSNMMGATKRIAEQYCQARDHATPATTRFLTVRFGNVLGSTGSVVPRFQEQLARGGPLTVTHPEITRYFMTVREAVELVLQATSTGTLRPLLRGRIMVLDMGKPIKIADLAKQMIRLAGLRPEEDIKITYTGLRPGEKLYEELFSAAEQLEPSGADGVFLAAAPAKALLAVENAIEQLLTQAQAAEANDAALRERVIGMVEAFTVQGEAAVSAVG